MKVQTCPSCGQRYDVERAPRGATFDCRECGQAIVVGEDEAPKQSFSLGLLLAGLVLIAALFLYANPSFGSRESAWPWELVLEQGPWSTKVALVVWAIAGVWALLTSLGILPRSRSVWAATLAGVLAALCTSSHLVDLRIDAALATLPLIVGMSAAGAGLLLAGPHRPSAGARVLAFGGGAMLVWWFAFRFSGGVPVLQELVQDVERHFAGQQGDLWGHLVPHAALLLAGVVSLVVGLGARSRAVGWVGLVLLLVVFLMPTVRDVVDPASDADAMDSVGQALGRHGTQALISSGLAVWLLATTSVADLVRNRRAGA